jgi:hypothetical protein
LRSRRLSNFLATEILILNFVEKFIIAASSNWRAISKRIDFARYSIGGSARGLGSKATGDGHRFGHGRAAFADFFSDFLVRIAEFFT